MHLGCSIGLAVGGRARHRVLMVLGGIPAESSSAKRDRLVGVRRPLDDGLAQRRRGWAGRLARADAVTLLSGRLVWTRGTMA
jgi:hypothetical protein